MVGTDELGAVAGAFAAELHAAMGADVFHDAHFAIVVAQQDDGPLAHDRAFEVAGIRDFGLEADVAPVALVEEALQFPLVQRGVGVDAERNAMGTVALPGRDELDGMFGGVHGRPLRQDVAMRCVRTRMICLHFSAGRAAAGQRLARHGRRRFFRIFGQGAKLINRIWLIT